MPCTSLSKIVHEYAGLNAGKVDFLNIDIEGLDEKAIAGIGGWSIKPTVICIEVYADSVRTIFDTPCCKVLEAAGYQLVNRIGASAVFQRMDSVLEQTTKVNNEN